MNTKWYVNPSGTKFERAVYQWNRIRTGGLRELRRKAMLALWVMLSAPLFVFNAIWAVPAVIVIRVIRPWKLVRMSALNSWNSGPFIIDASLYLAQRSLKPQGKRVVDLFWFPVPACNNHWALMVRRKFVVHRLFRYLVFFNKLIPGGSVHSLPPTGMRDLDGVFQQPIARFEYTTEEDEVAKVWLRRQGWQDGEPFVCLQVRDSAYFSCNPIFNANFVAKDTGHNDFRNSDIATYVEAVRELVDKGYWVIRMGKAMRQRFPLSHPRIIDYPFVEDQNDLLDMWLPINCTFFVTTGSGIDVLAIIYNRPTVHVNYIPINLFISYSHNISIFKRLRWKDSGHLLKLQECLQHGYGDTTHYEEAGIVYEDNTPAEITAAVRECEQRVAGTWVETEKDKERQRHFWEVLRAWPDFHKYHGYVHPESRIGRDWLRSIELPPE